MLEYLENVLRNKYSNYKYKYNKYIIDSILSTDKSFWDINSRGGIFRVMLRRGIPCVISYIFRSVLFSCYFDALF